MVVVARDGRGRNASAAVTVTIVRDEQPPQFTNIPSDGALLSENVVNGTEVYTLEATDPDLKVCTSYVTNTSRFGLLFFTS